MAKVAEKTDDDKVVKLPTALIPSHIRKDFNDALASNHWHVIAMADWTLQTLNDHPNVWRVTQKDVNKSIQQDDDVFIVAFDRSWAASFRVWSANANEVQIGKPVMHWSGRPSVSTWEDSYLKALWKGTGFNLFVKPEDEGDDPVVLAEGLPHMDAVQAEVRAYYARRA